MGNPISQPLSLTLAQPLHSYLAHARPDLNLTPGIIAAELHKQFTPPHVTMQGAWKLAGVLVDRTGQWKTFGKLGEAIASLDDPFAGAQSAPVVSPFPVSAVPRQPVAVLPVKARRCAAHSWESAGACGACRSEILSGMRAEADYGNPDAHLSGESDEAA